MDKYALVVILLAPGFVACSVGFLLHDFQGKRDTLGTIMRYFAYSFFALPFALALASATGLIPWDQPLSLQGVSARQIFLLSAIVAVSSVTVGAIWPLFLRGKLLYVANCIDMRRGGNGIFLKARLFDELFDDGKPHFLVIEKDGKVAAMGMYASVSAPDAGKTELALYDYPEYRAWFDYAQNCEEDHPLKHRKTTYLALEDSIVVSEYEFPAEWGG